MTRKLWYLLESIVPASLYLASLSLMPAPAIAQAKPESAGGETAVEAEAGKVAGELAASGIFRSLLLVYSPRGEKGLSLEGRAYNSHSTTVASLGLSKTFALGAEGRYGRFAPGLSAVFGDLKAAPALTARYEFEQGRFEAALGLVQALMETNGSDAEEKGELSNRYDNISDGNHLSYRVAQPLLVGFTWEHIQFRREQEVKYGIRAAYRIKPGWEVLAFGLFPKGGELRLGLTVK